MLVRGALSDDDCNAILLQSLLRTGSSLVGMYTSSLGPVTVTVLSALFVFMFVRDIQTGLQIEIPISIHWRRISMPSAPNLHSHRLHLYVFPSGASLSYLRTTPFGVVAGLPKVSNKYAIGDIRQKVPLWLQFPLWFQVALWFQCHQHLPLAFPTSVP